MRSNIVSLKETFQLHFTHLKFESISNCKTQTESDKIQFKYVSKIKRTKLTVAMQSVFTRSQSEQKSAFNEKDPIIEEENKATEKKPLCEFVQLRSRVATGTGEPSTFAHTEHGSHWMRHRLVEVAMVNFPQQLMD